MLHDIEQNVMVWQQSIFVQWIVCLKTVAQPLPKPVLHTVRSSAPAFNFQYPLVSVSSSSCLRLPPRLPITPILPSIFSSVTCFRRHFLHQMWQILLALIIDISIQKRKETSVFYPKPLLRRRERKPRESLKDIRGSADIYIFLLPNACLVRFAAPTLRCERCRR